MHPSISDDSMTPPLADSHPTLDLLVAEARAASEALKTRWQDVEAFADFLSEVKKLADTGFWFQLRELMERQADKLKLRREQMHPAIPTLEGLYRQSRSHTEEILMAYPSEIGEMAKRLAPTVEIDLQQSRHPKYYFDQTFLCLKIDERKRRARLTTRNDDKLGDIPCDILAVESLLRDAHRRLFERPFDGDRFLSELRDSYMKLVSAEKKRDGDHVSLRAIMKAASERDRKFRADEFVVDLSRLVERGPDTTRGFKFQLQQSKDTEEGILLWGASARGMVNLITFHSSTL